MLTALLAQEARCLARTHLTILGVCLLVGAGLIGVGLLDVPVLSPFAMLLAIGAFMVPAYAVFIHCLVEYWQSMYGQRGYLTMVIPVRGRLVYAAKVAYGVLASAVAAVVSLAGVAVAFLVNAHIQGVGLSQAWEPVRRAVETLGVWRGLLLALTALLMCLAWMIMDTALMSIGAQGRWNHLGLGAPVIGFIILYGVSQVVVLVSMMLVPLSIDLTTGEIGTELMLGPFLESVRTDTDPQIMGLGFLPATWILAAVMGWWAVRAIEEHTSLR
ncbi:MAG: hypothetical protein Q4E00_01990 [Actinomyces bowdenii]|nr:hypothetical protein [Actinomyces bowdenii]